MSYIKGVIQRFNALPITQKIRAHLNAAEYFIRNGNHAARERSMEEVARLKAQMKAKESPGVPDVRLGAGDTYVGMTALGPAVVHEKAPTQEEFDAEVESETEFQLAKQIALMKRKNQP